MLHLQFLVSVLVVAALLVSLRPLAARRRASLVLIAAFVVGVLVPLLARVFVEVVVLIVVFLSFAPVFPAGLTMTRTAELSRLLVAVVVSLLFLRSIVVIEAVRCTAAATALVLPCRPRSCLSMIPHDVVRVFDLLVGEDFVRCRDLLEAFFIAGLAACVGVVLFGQLVELALDLFLRSVRLDPQAHVVVDVLAELTLRREGPHRGLPRPPEQHRLQLVGVQIRYSGHGVQLSFQEVDSSSLLIQIDSRGQLLTTN